MRTRNACGILGSFAGIASSTAALAYFSLALLVTTGPVLASASSCISFKVALVLAQATEDAAEDFYMDAFADLAVCMTGSGPCTIEEVNVVLTQIEYEVSVEMRNAAEGNLSMCEASNTGI